MARTSVSPAETIAAWLRSEGHVAEVHATTDRYAQVHFRTRGLRFFLSIDAQDADFFYLRLPLTLPAEFDELTLRRAAARVEQKAKVLKVELDLEAKTCYLSAEQFVSRRARPKLFWRYTSILATGMHDFWTTLDDEAGRTAAARFCNEIQSQIAEAGSHAGGSDRTEDPR